MISLALMQSKAGAFADWGTQMQQYVVVQPTTGDSDRVFPSWAGQFYSFLYCKFSRGKFVCFHHFFGVRAFETGAEIQQKEPRIGPNLPGESKKSTRRPIRQPSICCYRFDGVVGYRICLTHRRSPVRTWLESFFDA